MRIGALRLSELDRGGAVEETASRAGALTRRGLLGGGAVLAAGLAAPAAEAQGSDEDILNYALALEYLQAAFYTEAERLGALRGAFAEQARVVGAHERAHVTALRDALGGAAIRRPRFDFGGVTEDQPAFRRTAVAFEDLGTAAYKDQAPRIRSRAYLAAALRIHSVEARHAAWIRRLAGVVPAPDAFDEPLPRRRVLRVVADTGFVTSAPRTSAFGSPRFTG
ncbi:MAG: ferritin-like domain-containing protein [Thermoleophilaceae bacterium]|nr:ferritin-like domain-containing protein [Thermoleophilaceae bacterium]